MSDPSGQRSRELGQPPTVAQLLDRLFPRGTARYEIAVQAAGNLVAAYFVLLLACLVGVGDYTPDLRHWVVFMTFTGLLMLLIYAIGSSLDKRVSKAIGFWLKSKRLKLRLTGQLAFDLLRAALWIALGMAIIIVAGELATPAFDAFDHAIGY